MERAAPGIRQGEDHKVHQQIRTSPGHTGENIRRVLEILGVENINVVGIGPDFESPHVRTVVSHEQCAAARAALEKEGMPSELRPAVTYDLPNLPGQLAARLEALARRGFAVESVLVLAAPDRAGTLVSIGVRPPFPEGWSATVEGLGGYGDRGEGCPETGA